ncbi:hypothetical protein P152DRAFT_514419 [Eremomyces bilateralis CBS 781.70]|uniref:Heterokaryon incompatibility domain-containing protein n=1 Tax=Eremomyces bilateralis CBS 781.70 TaxID=1392243 RepID=A0A6G1G2V6_9PEZI|nr:uncharacterized protein P152DRAFT_514419 [Eremomyces bilateralis CBS 781.70]KAF1812261.1 hypothetical protein P152DRAFT_514419 [Eremomyces bilateralis CBS 781.70]
MPRCLQEEHLMLDKRQAPLLWPYLLQDGFEYDGHDFDGYPQRCGWDFSEWYSTDPCGAGLDIQDWLLRQKMDIETRETMEAELAAFLQAWLFFGLLTYLCDPILIHTARFILNLSCCGQSLLTTASLESLLVEYRKTFFERYPRERKEAWEDEISRLMSLLDSAHQIQSTLGSDLDEDSLEITRFDEIHFFSGVLVGTLAHFVEYQLDVPSEYMAPLCLGEIPVLQKLLRVEGWCKYSRQQFTNLNEPDIQAYAFGLIRYRRRHCFDKDKTHHCRGTQIGLILNGRIHCTCPCHKSGHDEHRNVGQCLCKAEPKDPSQIANPSGPARLLIEPATPKGPDCNASDACTGHECVAAKAGDDFEPYHLLRNCVCQHEGPPMSEIIKLLEDGHIPVIEAHLPKNSSSPFSFTVRKAVLGEYVALSHVWGDGLGNQKNNSIPRCQLIFLLQALHDPVVGDNGCTAFWIDAFCIPVGKAYQKLRDFSIQRMHAIYKESCYGLVLDADISLSMSKRAQPAEIFTRVLLSNWAGRLWTFQEGALPPVLFLRTRDGKVRYDNLLERVEDYRGPVSLMRSSLARLSGVVAQRENPRIRQRSLNDEDTQFEDVSRSEDWGQFEDLGQSVLSALQYRSTSRKDDEAVCIATTLGRPTASIQNCQSANDKIVALLKLLPVIPPNILFNDSVRECLPHPGYRWCPTTMLLPQSGIGLYLNREIECASGHLYRRPFVRLHPRGRGVVCHCHAIRIFPSADKSLRWDITLTGGRRCLLSLHPRDELPEAMKSLVILLPHPMDAIDSRTTGIYCLLVTDHETSVGTCPQSNHEPMASGTIILRGDLKPHSYDIESLDRDEVSRIQGELMEPRWWVLDGTAPLSSSV